MNQKFHELDKQFWPQQWISAWNAHDMPSILSHYSDDLIMVSPMIQRLMGVSSSSLHGKNAVAEYWQKALQHVPDLKFELLFACWGEKSVILNYKGVGGRVVSEVLQFNESGQICRGHAHYAD